MYRCSDGGQLARLASRQSGVCAPALRVGIILKLLIEGGRRPFASGTPATRGAHNSGTLVQQPDQQSLV